MIKIINGILAILGGVGGSLALFWLLNFLVERLPGKWSDRLKPWVFAGPATVFISIFLVYPTLVTVYGSLFDRTGAATIWRFVYEYRPGGQQQIGLLNAIWTGLGGEPQVWLQLSTAKLNSFLLMIILIWLQTGYCMVILSAAIKGVPEDTIEAARIDGATEVQAFFRIIVPQIWGTVVTVFVTVFITVMKIFDIVYVMTNGRFETNVVAVAFFKELFEFNNQGRSAAIVVILLLAVTPLMWYQVRRFRAEESMR